MPDELRDLSPDRRSSAGDYAISGQQHHRSVVHRYRTSHALLLPRDVLLAQHDVLQHLVDVSVREKFSLSKDFFWGNKEWIVGRVVTCFLGNFL